MRRLWPMAVWFVAIIGSGACNPLPPMTPAETGLKLLSLHGLLGKTPGERSAKDKNTLVSQARLNDFFVDLQQYDQFTGELFTGVILGALAQNQSNLLEEKKSTTATVTAGEAVIHFDLVNDVWKINLQRTIPEAMKKRAVEEKSRYEAARAAAQQAQTQQ